MRPFSLRARLLLLLVGGAAAVTLVGGLAVDRLVRARVVAGFDQALAGRAIAMATLTVHGEDGVEMEFADEFSPEFEDPADPQYFQLQLRDGQLLELSRSFAGTGIGPDARLQLDAIPSGEPRFTNVVLPDGRTGRQVQMDFIPQLTDAVADSPATAGATGWLHEPADGSRDVSRVPEGRVIASIAIARERASLDHRLLHLRLVVHGMGLALVLVVAGLSAVALSLGLRPVDRLARDVQALDASRLGTRLDAQALPRELRPIVDQLNGLLERVGATISRERQLTSDIAHDLKTPVAELRALCDVAVRWPDNPETTARFFEDARDVALKLQRTIERLLALARHDAGKESVEISSVDLAELVAATVSPLAASAAARDIVFDLRVPAATHVESDRPRLAQVLANLFENAVVHSVSGTTITVLAHGEGARDVRLDVTNQCEGLAPEDLVHAFERFWRKDAARGDGAHAGLGLPLARATSELLGHELAIDVDKAGRFTATLRMPVAASSASFSQS